MNALLGIQIIGILIVIGIIVYVVIKYIKFKKTTSAEIYNDHILFDKQTEKSTRVSELSNIVSQMNTINNDIYNTIQQDTTEFENELTTNQAEFKNIVNSAFNFTDGNGNPISVNNTAGVKNITTNNLTAKHPLSVTNLKTSGNVNICRQSLPSPSASYSPSSAKCTQFEDTDGNLYLTDIGPTPGAIILDGKNGALINNDLKVLGTMKIKTESGKPSVNISSPENSKLTFSTDKMGIGNGNCKGTTKALLNINSTNDKLSILKLSNTYQSKIVDVSTNHGLTMFRDQYNYSRIKPSINNTTRLPQLVLSSKKVRIPGSLIVKGKISQKFQ